MSDNIFEGCNNYYVNKFAKLKCQSDILDVSGRVNNLYKEISESMALIERVKNIVLKKPNFEKLPLAKLREYNILDLCAGNALGSLMAAYRFPVTKAVAVDILPRERKFQEVKKFKYINMDIYNDNIFRMIDENTIIIAVHACQDKAIRITDIFARSKAAYLYMMPCCIGSYHMSSKAFLEKQIGDYLTWCFYLSMLCEGNVHYDKRVLSNKNAIVVAKKDLTRQIDIE